MVKNSRFLLAGALLLSMPFSVLGGTISVHPKHKDIGFVNSPSSVRTECLLDAGLPGRTTTVYQNSAVEPFLAVNPKNPCQAVAVWQQDRISNGGALEIGIAHTENGGKKWSRTIIPFQRCNGGITARSSDPWVSYSADGKKVYLTVLNFNDIIDPNTQNQQGITALYSEDNGKSWSNPIFVKANTFTAPIDDKNSITADPVIADNAYLVWDTFLSSESFHSDTWFTRTTTGGLSWEDSRPIYNPFLDPELKSNGIENDSQTIGNIVVSLPNGELLCFMNRIYARPGTTDEEYINDTFPFKFLTSDIAVIRSSDKGLTWNQTATQIAAGDANNTYTCGYEIQAGKIVKGLGTLLRTAAGQAIVFSVAVDKKTGALYVVWQDARFNTPGNQLSQIVLSASHDNGVTWSTPVKVSRTPDNAPNPQAFTPSVAVNDRGQVGILYHDFRCNSSACSEKTNTNTWFALYNNVLPAAGSTGMGLDFVEEKGLSGHPYIVENGPVTGLGVMTNGDYQGLEAVNNTFYALYTESFKGPFKPATTIFDTPESGKLILDNNRRTAPFFSKIKVK
ncbi:exo-alpha-sialidase [Candidatus Dependentiae bacterium]|nr:exo-alpha-sialidase [Candidatus Dependentiae bacterium]